jgi:hypothetical protein
MVRKVIGVFFMIIAVAAIGLGAVMRLMFGVTNMFSVVIVVGGVILLIIAIVLFISAKNANKQFNPYGGYVHPNARGDYERPLPQRRDTSSMDNFSGSRGGYQSPSGRPGYQSPSGRPGYQSPNNFHSSNTYAEPEVPLSPKTFKQPDYEDFFAPTRQKKMLSADVVKPEGDIDSIVRNTHDDPRAIIDEVADMNAIDEQAEALPDKKADESPVADLIEVGADDEIVVSALELLDFDNAAGKSGNSSDGGLSKRADFWSKWELDDGDVRPAADLPDFLEPGLDELGAVDVISAPSESFGSLREAPPEPDEMDYFTPAEGIKSFDMNLDEYLNTDFLNHENNDSDDNSEASGVWVDEDDEE